MNDTYTVLLRQKKLPLALLEDPEARKESKADRARLRSAVSFAGTFGKRQTRKRPKLATDDLSQLLQRAEEHADRRGPLFTATGGSGARCQTGCAYGTEYLLRVCLGGVAAGLWCDSLALCAPVTNRAASR